MRGVADTRTTTLYIIAYDIPNDRRRGKVHKILSGYGHWTQYSLFECFLTEKQYIQLRHRVERHVLAGEDSIRFYPVCAACRERVETIGSAKTSEPLLYIV